MKKHYIYIALSFILASAVSCTVIETNSYDKSSGLGYFADKYVNDAVISSVKALLQCEINSENILKPGFETTQNGIYLKLISAIDSTWTASNAIESDRLVFSTEIKMLPDYTEGLHQWKCSNSGTYYESDTYSASFTTLSTAVMKWEEKQSSTSYIRTLTISGQFLCIPVLQTTGEKLDRCTITYDKSPLDAGYREFRVTLNSLRY